MMRGDALVPRQQRRRTAPNWPTLLRAGRGELFWKITEGRNQMPSFATALSERQRWDVVNYLRSLSK